LSLKLVKPKKRTLDIGRYGRTPAGEGCPNPASPPCPCPLSDRCREWFHRELVNLCNEGKYQDLIVKMLEVYEELPETFFRDTLEDYGFQIPREELEKAISRLIEANLIRRERAE